MSDLLLCSYDTCTTSTNLKRSVSFPVGLFVSGLALLLASSYLVNPVCIFNCASNFHEEKKRSTKYLRKLKMQLDTIVKMFWTRWQILRLLPRKQWQFLSGHCTVLSSALYAQMLLLKIVSRWFPHAANLSCFAKIVLHAGWKTPKAAPTVVSHFNSSSVCLFHPYFSYLKIINRRSQPVPNSSNSFILVMPPGIATCLFHFPCILSFNEPWVWYSFILVMPAGSTYYILSWFGLSRLRDWLVISNSA